MLEQYTLYIRRHDKAMQLREQESNKPVEIASWFAATQGDGLFILLDGRTGILLIDDEIVTVDTFFDVENRGKGDYRNVSM